MSVFRVSLSPERLRRYRQVVEVLARQGFGAVLHESHLDRRLGIPARLLRRPIDPATLDMTSAMRLRLALEELGPTFVKLGQVLSTRPDLLPAGLVAEMTRLQDQAPPVPWPEIQVTIETELGRSVDAAFATFERAPLASASLGQVHAAVRHDGLPVVVKVQRPHVEHDIAIDIDVLRDLAALIQPRARAYLITDLNDVVEEFATALRGELSYVTEARNAERCGRNFASEAYVVVPKIHWDLTTERVLTMERIDGVKIDDLDRLAAAGVDRTRVAERLTQFFIKSIMEDGFFHADPHPGNFRVLPQDRIAVLDFGRIGRLSHRDQLLLARLARDVVRLDARDVSDGLIELTAAHGTVDSAALERDLTRLLHKYEGMPLQDVRIGPVFQEALDVAFRHRLHVPGQWALLVHTLSVAESVGARLAPDQRIFDVARPYLLRLAIRQWSPTTWGPDLLDTASDWVALSRMLPRTTSRVLEQIERGRLTIEVRVSDVDPILHRLDRIANRLTVGLLIAALIIGLGYVMPAVDFTGQWGPVQLLAVFGFVAVCLLGLWLVWRMWRLDRRRP